jgi:hypothetical protein
VIVALMLLTELRVKPVVRPLFFTAWPTKACAVVLASVPIPRISPLLLTCPVRTAAIAASTLSIELIGAQAVKSATMSPATT